MAAHPSTGPGRLVDAPVEEVARAVVAVLDEEDADILTGYDRNGGYGHPDHVQVHQVARAAQHRAARRPVLLEATVDRTWFVRALRVLRLGARLLPGLTLPGDDVYTSRAEVSQAVDVRAQVPVKREALAAHRSQRTGGTRTLALLLGLPGPLARLVLGTEWFVEAP
jgi:LmbE family N-acetylglucosaminyl deacetylase